ncbi:MULTISPECIES: hypothetical protein [unclassified Sphingobium]|jgi:hypothetical protein|uniref:hypothetical protein n=1 Tax=unclassified Sphingobium TaxID=2611147 RepID=UPI0007F38BFD|nr:MULTISPECIES: hypothetical protein [unclassified Sphingobium]OAN53537.1 hypothetical protein A7Q26_05850 [Sphingobium sp. TCM1]
MTLENRILQRLAAGPVGDLTIEGAAADEMALTLKIMAARRQICIRAGQVSLFWHRHMIPAPRMEAEADLVARPVMG